MNVMIIIDARTGGTRKGGAIPNEIRRGGKMRSDEALKVLNIEKSEMNRKTIEEVRFSYVFFVCLPSD